MRAIVPPLRPRWGSLPQGVIHRVPVYCRGRSWNATARPLTRAERVHISRRFSSPSQVQTSDGVTREYSWWKYLLPLASSAILAWAIYSRQQGTASMEGLVPGVDPTLVPRTIDPDHYREPVEPKGHLGEVDFPIEQAIFTTAPNVPPRITRDHPVVLQVPLETTTKTMQLTSTHKYEMWTFNDRVPGPFIRARVGDVLELSLTNRDESGNPHNIDCHAVMGPGGGAGVTTASEGETKTARFHLAYPGLFVYHCAAAPVPVHIANGMYGLIYVQPEEGDLPPVDREYFIMQSEFYCEPPEIMDNGRPSPVVEFSYPNALDESPTAVVFNGHEGALTIENPLKAKLDETVRIYFGNAGPNLTSSFHVIGSNFHRLYRDADVLSPPARYVQTTSVPSGGATIVDMKMTVPGTYTILDHAIFRLDKGAVGYLNVAGPPRPDIYESREAPAPCVGCKLHP